MKWKARKICIGISIHVFALIDKRTFKRTIELACNMGNGTWTG